MSLYVLAVVPRQDGRSFLVIDSEDTKYITQDVWLASLAQSYQKSGEPVRLDSGAGWYYRNLTFVAPEEA
jgi:hypothetical protein